MTLAEIRRLVTNYSGRTDPDFLNNVDDFIRLGHRYVERAWIGREQHLVPSWSQTFPLPAGHGVIQLPAAYRHSAALQLYLADPAVGGVGVPLMRFPQDAVAGPQPWRMPDGRTINLLDFGPGEPIAYVVAGRQLHLRPLAAAAREVHISGLGWAEPLRYDSDETVVSQAAPEAVLYAALREAWSFLGDPIQKATWEAEATRAIEAWMRDGTQEELGAARGMTGLPLHMDVFG
jgi:hypothetical protein